MFPGRSFHFQFHMAKESIGNKLLQESSLEDIAKEYTYRYGEEGNIGGLVTKNQTRTKCAV